MHHARVATALARPEARRLAAPRPARRGRGGRGAATPPRCTSSTAGATSVPRAREAEVAELLEARRPRFDYDHYRILVAPPRQARRPRRAARRLMHCELVVPGLFGTGRQRASPRSSSCSPAAAGRARRPAPGGMAAAGLRSWRGASFPAGALTLLARGDDPGEAAWARADPVHLRVMRDHLAMVPGEAFELSAPEANALCEALNATSPPPSSGRSSRGAGARSSPKPSREAIRWTRRQAG